MPEFVDLDQLTDATDVIRSTVAHLEAGKLVVVPDDVGLLILASPLNQQGREKIRQLTNGLPTVNQVVALADQSVVDDYTDGLSDLVYKLAGRCWPGPVAIRCRGGETEGLATDWAPESQRWAVENSGRAFYVPGNGFAHAVLGNLPSPALGIIVPESEVDSVSLDGIDLVVRSSEERYPEGHTLVNVNGDHYEIERAGVVSDRILSRLTGEVFLFICTGNTCRSPMAEGLFRKMVANRLNCQEDELLDRGYTVISAGLSAYPGAQAAGEAITLLKEEGIDLTSHESQPVTEELLFHCDYIITMTHNHMDAILHSCPELSDRVRLLSAERRDVSDPVGGGRNEYQQCRNEIEVHLKALLDQHFQS